MLSVARELSVVVCLWPKIFQVVKAWLTPPLLFDNAYAQMLAFQDQDVHTALRCRCCSIPWLVDRLWNSCSLGTCVMSSCTAWGTLSFQVSFFFGGGGS